MTPAMSSWGVRKPVKTYSRQKRQLYEEEPATKRRRVNADVITEGEEETVDTVDSTDALPTSSPSGFPAINSDAPLNSKPPRDESSVPPSTPRKSIATLLYTPTRDIYAFPTSSPEMPSTIFSDGPLNSTPPTSPIPQKSSPPQQTKRPMFSIFKRKADSVTTSDPLSERSLNVQSPSKPRPKKKRLVQMQLDLVGELRKTCRVCGMEYIPSNAEDATLHRKFHAMNVGGVDFTKAFVDRLKQNQVWTGGDGSFIAAIGRKDTLAFRNKASDVLKLVNTELAAVKIPEEELWSQIPIPVAEDATARSGKGQKSATGQRTSNSDRFKVYLYIRANTCVGACLAERILEAYTVQAQADRSHSSLTQAEHESSSISIGAVADPAILGISRIWTSNSHRKLGIATRLLDTARSDFLYGMSIEKDRIAFSQPTESGGQLARKWFGQRAGWHVYID